MGYAAYSKIVRALSIIRSQPHGATVLELMERLECSRSTVERILQELENSGFELSSAHHPGDDHRTKRWSLAREGLLTNPAATQLLSLTLSERLALERIYRSTADASLRDALSKVLALQASLPLKWSQKTGQLAKVYPKPMKGYENGEAPEFYRSV